MTRNYESRGLDASQMYEKSKRYQTEMVPATAFAGLGRLLARIYWMLYLRCQLAEVPCCRRRTEVP
jgi:hypothetical protein